jgi:nucleotide-binding universal stress UspA family protein
MKPVNKILVPIDFSPHSSEAIERAADMACRYGATLELLHVFNPVAYAMAESQRVPDGEQVESALDEFRHKLVEAQEDARAAGAPRVTATLLEGGVFESILRFARENGHDLIVMGTHGRSGLPHMVIGSIAARVVRTSSCPVLTVRAPG